MKSFGCGRLFECKRTYALIEDNVKKACKCLGNHGRWIGAPGREGLEHEEGGGGLPGGGRVRHRQRCAQRVPRPRSQTCGGARRWLLCRTVTPPPNSPPTWSIPKPLAMAQCGRRTLNLEALLLWRTKRGKSIKKSGQWPHTRLTPTQPETALSRRRRSYEHHTAHRTEHRQEPMECGRSLAKIWG